jgi:hypothetical protein
VNRYRIIDSDRAAATATPLEADENAFRVTARLTEAGYRRVAALLAETPAGWLHLWDRSPDLEALRHFPGLGRLMVTNLSLESWNGLRHVAGSLEELAMGDTTMRRVSVLPMAECRRLRTLRLIGPARDAEAIARLDGIEELTLRSVTLSSLAPMISMRRLRSLDLHLGGTNDLALLPELAQVEELDLWRIRGLRDVSVLGAMPRLRELRLQSMSAVTELPSLGRARALRRLVLDTMKGISDLRPVAEAPALEELLLVGMSQLTPESLDPLIGHPTLRSGIWGFGSMRKNAAAYDRLPLGDPPYGHPQWGAPGAIHEEAG